MKQQITRIRTLAQGRQDRADADGAVMAEIAAISEEVLRER